MFAIHDYDYDLPPELVAQQPVRRKDASRLLRLDRRTGGIAHHRFHELADFLSPLDVMVINNTEVVPARIIGKKETGGAVEALVLDYPGQQAPDGTVCQCMVKSSKRLKPGQSLVFEESCRATVVDGKEGLYRIRFDGDLTEFLYQKGRVPLPPYIQRDDRRTPCDDSVCYQTVYAVEKGAVAAPTAGLHFTRELLDMIRAKGVAVAPLTLHVGHGTFLPVRVEDIRQHRMHRERFSISPDTVAAINRTKAEGGRVVAVGTTVVRVLEYLHKNGGGLAAADGECDLFIYPGFSFGLVDAMVTNFHLPRSTLLMLVSAFAGRENVLAAYRAAIAEAYRFYSYGDAMLIA
ncbi:MAG: tRNA preQ1(34) S-adenosylmethionine ribosyltransferase-isomerase QueA [Thermodesulfobacteriota bacterium]